MMEMSTSLPLAAYYEARYRQLDYQGFGQVGRWNEEATLLGWSHIYSDNNAEC